MPTVYSTADAGIEYQGDKKKKKQNPTTAETVAAIRQNLAQDEYRQEVQNFREATKAAEVSPYKMARIIASGVTAEDTYNQVYEKFTEGLLKQDDPSTPENEGLLYLSQLNDPTATAMLFDQWRSKKKMDYWRTDFPSQIGPLTIVHGVSLPELQSAAVSQIFADVSATYGGEAAAMALQNSLTGDPEQQAETWRLIEALSQRTVPTGDTWEARQPDFLADPGTEAEIPITELFAQVLMDPAKFDTMSPGQQQDLITAAGQQLQAHQEMLDSGIIDQVTAAQDVLMKEKGWKTVLSKEEAQRIRSFYDSPQAVAAREKFNLEQNLSGDVAVSGQLGDLGIERYRDKGGVQTFTFQEEWVKQNFAKYEGVKTLILQKFPNAEFIYGVNGIVGQVLDSIGAGTDVISAPFSAAGIQAKELGSRIGTSPEDRQGWLDYADFIQAEIDAGRVPKEEMANAVSEMYEFRDRGTDTFGLSTLWQDTQKYSQPGHFGTGFGDAITQSLEFYPGDPGYEGAHAALTLFGNIVFDPTIVFGKVFKAARLAKSLPAGTVISKSRMTQVLFDAIAQPPEMLLASKRGLGVMDSIMLASSKVDDADLLTIRLIDMGMDESIASEIAKAAGAGRESLQSTMLKHMMGDGATPILQRKLLPQLDDVSKGLARIEVDLPKQIKSVRRKLQYRTAKAGKEAATLRPVTLTNQKIDSTGRAIGDLTTDDYVWVRTQDLANNVDTQLTRVGTDIPQPGYETSLQQEILTNGYPKPLETMFDPATGRYSLTDGNHALEAALGIGDEYVPVRTVTAAPEGMSLQEISRYVPPTHPTPLTELAPEKFRGLSTKTQDEIAKLTDQLAATQEELKMAQAGKADLVSQKAFIESVLNGESSRTLTPLRRLPTKTSLRGLAPSETKWGRIWDAATGTVRFEGDPGKINRLFQMMRRWGQDTGTGEKLFFQLHKVAAGTLPDEAGLQTYKKIRDFARFAGTPDDVIEDALKGLLKAQHTGSQSQIYEAFVKGYENIIENASRIPELGKSDLKRMWGTSFVDRNTALVVEGQGASAHSVPALYENTVDNAGQVYQAAVPSIEADMLQMFKLPSYEQMRDYVGFVRAHAKGMQQAGKLKKGAADAYFAMTKSWRGFNALWTQGVLLGRMPFALPARIQLEQMVRIEAVGYSSILHPSEWWKSVRSKDQFTQFAMNEREVLGVSVENYMDARKAAGEFKRIVTMVDEPDVAIRAMAGRIKAFNASPSSRLYISDLSDAEIVAKMQADPFYWDKFGDLWDDVIKSHTATDGPLTSYEAIVHNIRKQYTDILGQGDGVERLRAAVKSGAITIDGKNLKLVDSKMLDAKTGKLVTEDGNLLADEMIRMYKNGEWKPHIYQFPAEAAHYMPPDHGSILRNISKGRDWAFEHFYARPDLKFGRRPLARQIAAREYTRLTKLGWSPAQATEQARVFGARQTADILFTIGANSSADYFARGLMPFFPAWKELARTWLVKVPTTMGGGGLAGWAVGAAALSQRVDAWVHFFEDTGITYKDGGQWRVKAPFLAPIVEKLTGLEGIDTSFSVDSFTSLLPVPSASEDDPFYKGLVPTLGAPSGLVLHQINEKFGGAFDGLEEALTLFGGDQSLGPNSLDTVLNAMGYTPPWQSGQSQHMQELRREWATIDALRIHYDEMYDTMPKQKDYKTENLFLKAQGAWLEELLGKAESSSKRWYLLRGISGALFPFSFKYDTEASRTMTAMWDVINGIETSLGDKDMMSPLLEAYRHMHPDRELYLTGKTVSLLPDNPDRVDKYGTFVDEIAEGTRLTFTSKQWLVWAMGSQEAALHRGLTDQIFNEFGSSPQKWLLSGYETAKKLRDEQIRWDGYLKQSSILSDILGVTDAAGEPTSFEQMYSNFYEAKQNRYSDLALGNTPHASLTLQQEQATEALDALNSLADFFGATQYTDASYLEVRRTLNDVADVVYTKSDDPVFRATGWWWNQVRPYFDAKNAVWSKIDATPSSARAPLYRKLAEIENDWATKQLKHPEWGVMPKPQDVMFQKLSPDARQLKLMDWATLPIEFLSRYQRQKVYGKSPKDTKLDTLVARISENEQSLDSIVNAKALSYSSTEYTDLRAFTDRKNAEAAKDLGVSDIYAKWQQPAYKRVSTQIHNPYWDQLVSFVDSGMRRFASADVSPRGSTAEAAEFQRRVIALAEQYRATDPNLNKIMEQLEIAYGEGPDKPAPRQDMYWPLFFDGFGTAPGYLLNTYNPYLGG